MGGTLYNDGNIAFGSLKVTLPGGVVCVGESIDFDEPMKELDREDEFGRNNGCVYIPTKITARMTLQLPTANVAIPERGVVLVIEYRGNPKQWVLKKVGIPYKQGELLKLNVEIAEVLNPDALGTPIANPPGGTAGDLPAGGPAS